MHVSPTPSQNTGQIPDKKTGPGPGPQPSPLTGANNARTASPNPQATTGWNAFSPGNWNDSAGVPGNVQATSGATMPTPAQNHAAAPGSTNANAHANANANSYTDTQQQQQPTGGAGWNAFPAPPPAQSTPPTQPAQPQHTQAPVSTPTPPTTQTGAVSGGWAAFGDAPPNDQSNALEAQQQPMKTPETNPAVWPPSVESFAADMQAAKGLAQQNQQYQQPQQQQYQQPQQQQYQQQQPQQPQQQQYQQPQQQQYQQPQQQQYQKPQPQQQQYQQPQQPPPGMGVRTTAPQAQAHVYNAQLPTAVQSPSTPTNGNPGLSPGAASAKAPITATKGSAGPAMSNYDALADLHAAGGASTFSPTPAHAPPPQYCLGAAQAVLHPAMGSAPVTPNYSAFGEISAATSTHPPQKHRANSPAQHPHMQGQAQGQGQGQAQAQPQRQQQRPHSPQQPRQQQQRMPPAQVSPGTAQPPQAGKQVMTQSQTAVFHKEMQDWMAANSAYAPSYHQQMTVIFQKAQAYSAQLVQYGAMLASNPQGAQAWLVQYETSDPKAADIFRKCYVAKAKAMQIDAQKQQQQARK
ncbi:hypothetical protein SARC_05194 [Sphaeroforma arctica JP610]|uniref:Uncharacterized protein n=1 Tax=Sphaeroforma arctica JP610 TaxID=667725 RepID=A0A0L0G124_9EUKA|nr:hypothetical protein SARC_05194 [Sphaeroforma arctica JP610]KNC82521.1 hypothetical protein SARC_05194 [Sphaeroforma arctica JP610]|eukprot:XP_014156423.1 hypothetical protein SARC_05194 [Sphaeroforma arctica JP610]